ncbi:protein of unknown function [Reichenbachiella agariperforans]|uniref:3-keto-alpha-glucoside-1,2-lyase/3-keto-2-hydroxy-glucal hydratase domain-containing protein n=1 Tax=Reichenbachiella agariperforans TaxID=156994 RepID=A0A1M6V7D9_REIAG|nr:DUF1080 domain-containing protein [Reichenbachiella agariperforans]SHK77305.1 protein of unknown function [Reichenbachiella agariperforans]
MIRKVGLALCLALSVGTVSAQWVDLFNGKDLKGWTQLGGKATYEVIDNEIVGAAVPDTPNSFLTTKKKYGDFILELEVFINSGLNSGIQIRSNTDKDYRDGVVHGYQVEIDPSSRGWSGGIYDEQRRGWIYPLSRNYKAASALNKAGWNKIHIEAIGSEINTWVNGVQCARLVDDMTAEGFIGLQVHSIWEDHLKGAQIKWRNIKILTSGFENEEWDRAPAVPELSYLKNQLTDWEQRNGFRLLWDGTTNAGWRGAKLDEFPVSGWNMADGVLTVQKTDGGESTGPGDIVTINKFANFELELEFKITEGANSGIKYYVDPSLNKGAGSAIGCEFQILDDEKHPDAKKGVNGNRTVGSLYDLITADNLSVKDRGKQFKGIGQWNKARIVAKDGKVEHWLNNEKVVTYDRHSQLFKALVAYSKYAKWENFGQWPEGCILLQDHGDEVSYRSIKIRELN